MAACPVAYRLGASALRTAPVVRAPTTLFAVGGLYGNTHALRYVRKRALHEEGQSTVVFNGDFNFFNAEPAWWREVNATIRDEHVATAGNVEVEMAAEAPSGLGCGCGYPAYVSPGVVERSDRIVARLRETALAAAEPELLSWLRGLPKALVAEVGAARTRVGIVHGDVDSLAGWQLGVESMEPPDEALRRSLGCDEASGEAQLPTTPHAKLLQWGADADVTGLLCTHTCLPYGQLVEAAAEGSSSSHAQQQQQQLAIFNNGSAGMPNFANVRSIFGVMTRVSEDPLPPPDSIYGTFANGLRYDAVPVGYDHEAWLALFGSSWPAGSDAHVSYHDRLLHGPCGYTPFQAVRPGVRLTSSDQTFYFNFAFDLW